MNTKAEKQKISAETMRFMRGKYALDEVVGKYYDIDCLKFRQGKKTILSINIHDDYYDFQIIFGKAEREKFEVQRDEFPKEIQAIYDEAHTYHDGKWMLIRVDNMAALEAVKQLILMKKKPNRKPFPKEKALYSDCGHRCDLCVHYNGGSITEAFREELKARLRRVYEHDSTGESAYWGDDMQLCNGCRKGGFGGESSPCEQKKCAAEKAILRCAACADYPCEKATAGYNGGIDAKRNISAEDVTWAILPYVPMQYGN